MKIESIFKSVSETDLALIYFKGCWVLDFWTLHFNLRGLCVLKVIGICFTMILFIQTNKRVVHLIGRPKTSGNVLGRLVKVLLSYI